MPYKCFEDLPIWQLAREQHRHVVEMSVKDGLIKDFRLKDQLKASSGSVMDNIAEGFGRGGNKEFINFLTIARGSNDEARSQVYQVFDRGYIEEPVLNKFVEDSKSLSSQLSSFIIYLQNTEFKGAKFTKH